jgi:hypothetical protein
LDNKNWAKCCCRRDTLSRKVIHTQDEFQVAAVFGETKKPSAALPANARCYVERALIAFPV